MSGEAVKLRFQMASLTSRERYKLLSGVVVPRPIAWVTTVGPDGGVNAAPFSYFNVMGSDPPVVAIGIGDRAGQAKDTARNIAATREFVVNLVGERTARAMNESAGDYPYGVDELARVGLTPVPSSAVRPPRIGESHAHLECREVTTVPVGKTRIVIGEVVEMHIREDLVDRERLRIHGDRLEAIGRMHGPTWYARTRELFELVRPRVGDGGEGAGQGD